MDKLEIIEQRLQNLEDAAFNGSNEIEEIEFGIYNSEVKSINSLMIKSSGNHRKWRETRDLRGAKKYSNWSVQVSVVDETGAPAVCDWIKLSNCNYRIKQSGVAVEQASISFTTDDSQKWDNISYDVEIKYNGMIYNKVTVTM